MRALGYAPPQAGVYISRWHHGSPAHRYGLYALNWVTELNGAPVPDLDTFVQIAQSLPDKSFACLKLCQLETTKTKVHDTPRRSTMYYAGSHCFMLDQALHALWLDLGMDCCVVSKRQTCLVTSPPRPSYSSVCMIIAFVVRKKHERSSQQPA